MSKAFIRSLRIWIKSLRDLMHSNLNIKIAKRGGEYMKGLSKPDEVIG